MSNKNVPQAYRSIIDKVVASVRPDFEENGIDENVLIALQQSWEAKLALSRVADFSSDPRLGAYQAMLPPLLDESAKKDVSVAADGSSTSVKQEDGLAASTSSSANGQDKASLDGSELKNGTAASSTAATSAASASTAKPKPKPDADSNEINSDLDESDSDLLSDDEDNDEFGDGNDRDEGDVIIALYEKVQRVKNKWKITLKDGIISVKGKDYLFQKCQGEFEW